jgi:hypothetical protein
MDKLEYIEKMNNLLNTETYKTSKRDPTKTFFELAQKNSQRMWNGRYENTQYHTPMCRDP